ncbi:protein RRP6-like 2 [Impatiens glandulifera]|uniref:protein RRP6-like 2 n=1 Tax=Impatiens glandulifera TaxID=253017 RepID=UPI001FB0C6D1|nr:protein RRP6-like 2 [Impatiens glandulifera]
MSTKEEAMELDPSESQSLKQKAEALHRLATGPLSSSLNKLSGSSRGLPSAKEFHYFYNFNEFKAPIKEIANKSKSILELIGSSPQLSGQDVQIPDDLDEAYDWLVNLNDDLYERVDVSADEFKNVRKKEEETGVRMMDSEDGFELVCGKKKKKNKNGAGPVVGAAAREDDSSHSVRVVTRDMKAAETKPKVPFHIPSIPRPQDVYKMVINNSNQPFEHVWLQNSDDCSIYKHPLEAFSFEDFVDKDVEHLEPVKPLSLDDTPFKFVDNVNDLKLLAAKLRSVNEFAVDLEHNHYRSFQGLTCVMQISTRAEDFVVDTLKLRIHIGPYLREVFKDPTKKKVIHGSDRDILWLQRDFGIYICNMFDTGQASRVLKLERNSLEYLLAHLCEVTANKIYQKADWRLRPLPCEMIKYAREDTHYLLYMYDLLRIRLCSSTSQLDAANPLAEVYKRSYDLCMQLYEKELLTEDSYLQIYGLQNADLNAQQLAVVAGLCEWRDFIARSEDESTGYILPNKSLIDIAKVMPTTTKTLHDAVVRAKYVEANLGPLVNIIKRSMKNASAFEAAVEYLKEKRLAMEARQNIDLIDDSQTPPVECVAATTETLGNHNSSESTPITDCSNATNVSKNEQGNDLMDHDQNSSMKNKEDETVIKSMQEVQFNPTLQSATRAIVQVQKKPSRGFGAMFGNSSTKRKLDSHKKEAEVKLEKIRSLMAIPAISFPVQIQQTQPPIQPVSSETSKMEETIHLDGNPIVEEPEASEPIIEEHGKENGKDKTKKSQDDILYFSSDSEDEEPNSSLQAENEQSDEQRKKSGENMSLSDLSSSFEKCFESLNQKGNPKQSQKRVEELLEVKPFDYEVARKEFKIGNEVRGNEEQKGKGNKDRKKKKNNNRADKVEGGEVEFAQGRRRQAFPMTGNRSSTFRK